MMKVLIVTGGIGSGKSLVCRMLTENHGIPVYEADVRAKALYAEVPSILDEMENALGVQLRDNDGVFQPKRLADVIFSDSDALLKVEDILFPRLKDDFSRWAQEQGSDIVAFESATVLEKTQFDGFGDIVLLVDAPKELRLTRASLRDGLAKEKIQDRMAAQPLMNLISDGGSCTRVNHVLLNDGSMEDLQHRLAEFMEIYGLTKML